MRDGRNIPAGLTPPSEFEVQWQGAAVVLTRDVHAGDGGLKTPKTCCWRFRSIPISREKRSPHGCAGAPRLGGCAQLSAGRLPRRQSASPGVRPDGRRNTNMTGSSASPKITSAKYGLPHTAALLMEKVADACDEAQPLITLPGDTQFKIFVRALHRRIKQRLQGRKFRK